MSHTIDVSKGQCIGTVSAQWASRPDDQKFTSLTALREQVHKWATESKAIEVLPSEIVARYNPEDESILEIEVADTVVQPTHWAFDQVCRSAGAPSQYLRGLPGPLAALNLNYGLQVADQKPVSAYVRENGSTTLRGITSTRYGRIFDFDVVDSVMQVAGDGTGDTRWKVPGCIDWSGKFGVTYNPNVDITKQNTTLYASDRDVFLFLVDDRNPIEVGKLANGDPDLMFRGFYVWNSEVGSKTFGFASMYLRGVCQNRNLWGVEQFKEVSFRHYSLAPDRFVEEAQPMLLEFANGSTTGLIEGVKSAKSAIVAKTDDERLDFLGRYGFSERAAKTVISTCEIEEGKLPESVWDFAQGVSAMARTEVLQENRLKIEQVAGKMLDKVVA